MLAPGKADPPFLKVFSSLLTCVRSQIVLAYPTSAQTDEDGITVQLGRPLETTSE